MSILEVLQERNKIKQEPEEEEEKGPNLFDFLNQISNKTTKHAYNKKAASAYLLSIWLSHEADCIDYVSKINPLLFYIPDEMVYNYYYAAIPKSRRFIRYSKKQKTYLREQDDINRLMLDYDMSEREASMVKKFMERL
jgi:hypothetical protein